ncbi:unnamed protein product [Vitrella brassicaformis CCMP3155]|uniref:Uncharacterized protein n=1 Tax=Vitrella brassicaformis (strain CCMP3155) TaxID=1169540 RepID=A0A0G4GRJ1_VITBC|nr:unnamed protein product [Vitrella brassicaformis CCMP3155]|eukprot:CEM33179.1 unnamed protein product [Vitrella brassicaformis CCMP3155]
MAGLRNPHASVASGELGIEDPELIFNCSAPDTEAFPARWSCCRRNGVSSRCELANIVEVWKEEGREGPFPPFTITSRKGCFDRLYGRLVLGRRELTTDEDRYILRENQQPRNLITFEEDDPPGESPVANTGQASQTASPADDEHHQHNHTQKDEWAVLGRQLRPPTEGISERGISRRHTGRRPFISHWTASKRNHLHVSSQPYPGPWCGRENGLRSASPGQGRHTDGPSPAVSR